MNMLNHSKFLGDGTKGLDFGEPTNKLAKCLEDLGKNEQDVPDETPLLLSAPDLNVNHACSPLQFANCEIRERNLNILTNTAQLPSLEVALHWIRDATKEFEHQRSFNIVRYGLDHLCNAGLKSPEDAQEVLTRHRDELYKNLDAAAWVDKQTLYRSRWLHPELIVAVLVNTARSADGR